MHEGVSRQRAGHHERGSERLVRIVDTAERELRGRWKDARITRLELWAERRLGQWVEYRYDRAGCLIAAVDAVGGVEAYEVDARCRMTATTLMPKIPTR
ncbi:hypothetical protein WMF27_35530 [Sorangium sp. So ce281]